MSLSESRLSGLRSAVVLPARTVLVLLAATSTAYASQITVTTVNDVTVSTDGLCSLREAVESFDGSLADVTCVLVAATGSTVRLSSGSYCLASDLLIDADITIKGVGSASVLDGGNIDTRGCSNSSDRVVTVEEGRTVRFEDLTIKGGASDHGGAGIFAYPNVNLTLDGVTVTDNVATGGNGNGGGVHIDSDSTLTIIDSTISNNDVSCSSSEVGQCATGGGIDTEDGVDVAITNTTISGNTVTTPSGSGQGGGIYLGGTETSSSSLSLSGSTVTGNTVVATGSAGALGGGISAEYCGSIQIDDSVVSDNLSQAETVRAFGGGVSLAFCDQLDIDDSTFDGNSALVTRATVGAYGGGFYVGSVLDTLITDSTFSDNTAEHTGASGTGPSYGGGIYVHDEYATLINTTISGNRVAGDNGAYGGGLFAKGDVEVYVVQSTVAYNEADGANGAYGGGVSHFPPSSDASRNEQVYFLNSILSNNSAVGGSNVKGADCYQGFFTLGNNIFSNDSNCYLDSSRSATSVTDLVDTDAQLSALADNGGAVQTHALGSSSPARGGSSCRDQNGTTVLTDARGTRRDTTCDRGAWEYGDRRRSRTSADVATGEMSDALARSDDGTFEAGVFAFEGCSTAPGAMSSLLAGLGLAAAFGRRRR